MACYGNGSLRIVECGCCGGYHRSNYYGDCRNDAEWFADEDEALDRLNVGCIEVERIDYDEEDEEGECGSYIEVYNGG